MGTFSDDNAGGGTGGMDGNGASGAGASNSAGAGGTDSAGNSGDNGGAGGFPRMPVGARRNMPPTAYLRVYSPLASFDDAEQLLIATPGHTLDASSDDEATLWRSLARISRPRVDPFPHGTVEQYRMIVLDREHGDVVMFCPAQEPLRAGIAASLLEDYVPEDALDVWFPPASAAAHSERLQEHGMWLAESPLYTRMSTWRIPLSWFTLFRSGDEEEVVEGEDSQPLSVAVRVPLVLALERAAYAVAALSSISMVTDDDGFGEGDSWGGGPAEDGEADEDVDANGFLDGSGMDDVDAVDPTGLLASAVELHDWLQQFHPDSVVELDYGLLTARAWPDDSVLDVADGLDALMDADMAGAVAAYFRLRRRWDSISMWAHAG